MFFLNFFRLLTQPFRPKTFGDLKIGDPVFVTRATGKTFFGVEMLYVVKKEGEDKGQVQITFDKDVPKEGRNSIMVYGRANTLRTYSDCIISIFKEKSLNYGIEVHSNKMRHSNILCRIQHGRKKNI